MIEYLESKLKESSKNIFKNDDIEKFKKEIKEKELNKEDIDNMLSIHIKNYFYKEHKNNEYDINKNLKIEILKISKEKTYVVIDNKQGFIKTYKPQSLNDFEVAYSKIANMFNIKTCEIKRIKFNLKNSLLVYDEYEDKTNTEEINTIIKEDDIIRLIQHLNEKISNKNKLIEVLIFYILIDNKDLSNNKIKIINEEISPLNSFICTGKKIPENMVLLNNSFIDKQSLIDCIFKNYYDNISNFIYKNFSESKQSKILEILDLEIDQKDLEKVKNKIIDNFKLISNLNKNKIEEKFKSFGINSVTDLQEYMEKYVEYGTLILFDNEKVKIPFGTLESTEGKNNKKITFDNNEIISTINKYYTKYIERINPSNIEITQLLKNISTISDILKFTYKTNYPLDILKYETANSLEQMEFISLFLESKNYEFKRFCLSEQIIDNQNNKKLTDLHFFVGYKQDEKWYYIENAYSDFKGIHEYENCNELIDTVVSKLIYAREKNPYKDLPVSKYIVNEINKIEPDQNYDKVVQIISKSKKINISNAIYMYNCENEIRKNILEGLTNAYILDNTPIIIKPAEDIMDINEYKEEFIKILCEKIMLVTYKDINDGINFYNVNVKGKQELSNKKEKVEIEKKSYTLRIVFILIIVICLIFLIYTEFYR